MKKLHLYWCQDYDVQWKCQTALFTTGDWTNPRENMEPIISEEIIWTNPEKSAAVVHKSVGIGR